LLSSAKAVLFANLTLSGKEERHLAISKERKSELVQTYVDLLNRSQGVIVTEYRGMNMAQFNELRARMRELGSTYMVIKNTLLLLALKQAGLAISPDLLSGPVAVAFAHNNLAKTAQAVLDYRKNVEIFRVKGALAGSSVFPDEAQVEALATLPPIEQIRGEIVGLIIAPAANLLSLLTAPAQDLVSVLEAGANQLVSVVAAYASKTEAAA
jgi:large subunit ribosomal protein L10